MTPKKENYLQIRISADLKKKLEELAALNGLTASEWVRDQIKIEWHMYQATKETGE